MLSSLSLRSFKCFDQLTLELRPLTLLTGLNGSGKSSIIQALLVLRQSFLEGFLREEKGLLLNGYHTELGTAEDVLYQWAEEQQISIRINATDQWQFAFEGAQSQFLDVIPHMATQISKGTWEQSLFTDGFQYLQAERIGPRASFAASEYQVGQRRQLGIQGEFAPQFLATFGDEEVNHRALWHPNATSTKLRDQTEAWLSEICPGVITHATRNKELERTSLRYSFRGPQVKSSSFRAKNVGFGITYTLPVIIALLSSKQDSLVLLENPEAHLHPKGQRHMGYLLGLAASAGIQVVAETHSEQILSGVRLALFAEKLSRDDVALYHCARHEQSGKFQVLVTPKPPERLHNIDEGPHQFSDQWDGEEASMRAAIFQESMFSGDPQAMQLLDIPEDKTQWTESDYTRHISLLLLAGAHVQAQRLAQEGTEKFPKDSELQKRSASLTAPQNIRTSEPQNQDSIKKNRDWVRQHREEYKGQWVALLDGQLTGTAPSLVQLKQTLQETNLSDYFITQVR